MRHSTELLRVTTAVVAAFILTVAAAPAQETRTWRLAEVGGAPLPVVVDAEDDCREEVVEGTLTLAADGTWTLVTRERETCGGDDVEETEDTEEGRYTMEGDTVRFLDEDGDPRTDEDDDEDDELDVEGLTTGTRSGPTLTVEVADGTSTLLFRQ